MIQIAELHIYERMEVTSGFGDIPTLQAFGDSILGARGMMKYFYTLPDNEINDWLVETYMERYEMPPDLFVPDAFAAGVALVQAIEKAQTLDTDTLIETMRGMSFETPKGTMTFREEDHQALQEMYIVEMQEVEGFDFPVARFDPDNDTGGDGSSNHVRRLVQIRGRLKTGPSST